MRNNKTLLVYTALVISVFLTSYVAISYEANQKITLSEPNNYGLALMGVIPSQVQCTHSIETYDSTNIIAQDRIGNKYLILESKLGDESCLGKI